MIGPTHSSTTPRGSLVTICLVTALALLMGGCALTFGYRHADWLLRRQVDHYLDLTSAQRRDVTTRLQALLSRHRVEALPLYAEFLIEAQRRVQRGGLTTEDMDWAYGNYDRFRNDLLERALPDGSALLADVTEGQIRRLEGLFVKEDQQQATHLHAPVSSRLEERAQKHVTLVEEWVGRLTREQLAAVRTWSLALPDWQPVWSQHRRRLHADLISLLRARPPVEEMQDRLRTMLRTPESQATPEFQAVQQRLRADVSAMILGIDRLLTTTQRQRAAAVIQRYVDDIRSLQAG